MKVWGIFIMFIISCVHNSLQCMETMEQRWDGMVRKTSQEKIRQLQKQINTGTVKNYISAGRQVPSQLIFNLDSESQTAAYYHNQQLMRQQQGK